MVLHTLNASPASAAFADCLRLASKDDAILLLGDGVYAALEGTSAVTQLQTNGAAIYVLAEDAMAAGIAPNDAFSTVDMDGFVTLTEDFPKQLAWY